MLSANEMAHSAHRAPPAIGKNCHRKGADDRRGDDKIHHMYDAKECG